MRTQSKAAHLVHLVLLEYQVPLVTKEYQVPLVTKWHLGGTVA